MTNELEGSRILQSFFGGAADLIANKDELNKINVFPVADGDTGSNLASLMQTILDSSVSDSSSVENVLTNVAEAALLGARGNSGIIFAQYLNGVAAVFSQTEKNTHDFVYSLNQAVTEAYQALIEPKEGTILTVMRVWAASVHQAFHQKASLGAALETARKNALEALRQTEFQLDVLQKNKLVDSGAKGFYIFINGFTEAFSTQQERISIKRESESVKIAPAEIITEQPKYRYCTELLLKNVQIEKELLKEKLADLGDSLILAGNQQLLKVHIHTNQPQAILNKIAGQSELVQQKVDDMQLQFEVTKQRKYPIAVVTDSIADLPKAFLLEEQVHVLPMNILVGETDYLDKLTIDNAVIRKAGAVQKLSTAQPAIRSVDALLSFLENKYEAILVVTVSSQLSGTYQLIKQRATAKKLSAKKIQVIDSKLNSAGQGLLVKAIIEQLKRKPDSTLAELTAIIEEIQRRCFIYVAVSDITPMLRSGRIPQSLGKLAKRLRLLPIVSLNAAGNGKLSGISWSQKQSEKKILKKVNRLIKKDQLSGLAIAHADNLPEAEEMARKLGKNGQQMLDFIVESSTAITVSAGIGSVAVAGIRKGAIE
ncbi:DAK2 domain-containing protein [Enterococcus sp. LJL51]|uniref:DAK2 domain-containing protein n=1 Tax=Enterococcus sp. LJL51 TaxID=3416656 RepID=UPI003CF87037